jgi:hypothetical protein
MQVLRDASDGRRFAGKTSRIRDTRRDYFISRGLWIQTNIEDFIQDLFFKNSFQSHNSLDKASRIEVEIREDFLLDSFA